MKKCIFCKIISEKIPCTKIYENHKWLFWIRNILRLPMVGFYNVEVLAKKR